MATLETVEKIRKLRAVSRTFREFHAKFDALRADSQNDKIGCGFEPLSDRFVSFSARVIYSSHVGRYGNSSCSTIFSADAELAQVAFIKALNIHQRTIFETMAKVLNDSANGLVEKARGEIEQVQAMLAAVEAAASAEVEAAQ